MQDRRRGNEGKGGDRHGNRRDLFLKVHNPEGMGGVQVVHTGHLLCLYFSNLPWDPRAGSPSSSLTIVHVGLLIGSQGAARRCGPTAGTGVCKTGWSRERGSLGHPPPLF